VPWHGAICQHLCEFFSDYSIARLSAWEFSGGGFRRNVQHEWCSDGCNLWQRLDYNDVTIVLANEHRVWSNKASSDDFPEKWQHSSKVWRDLGWDWALGVYWSVMAR
jgi:hypothetical protein